MHQPGIDFSAGHGDIPHCQGIHLVSGAWFLLGNIHLVVGGSIEDHRRIERHQRLVDAPAVGDVELLTLPAGYVVAAGTQFTAEFDTQLSGATEYRRFFAHYETKA